MGGARPAGETLPGALRAHPGFTTFGFPVLFHREAGEIIRVRVGADDDGTPIAAIATVRPALGDVLLPPERGRPAAAIPALHEQIDAIDEHALLRASGGRQPPE